MPFNIQHGMALLKYFMWLEKPTNFRSRSLLTKNEVEEANKAVAKVLTVLVSIV